MVAWHHAQHLGTIALPALQGVAELVDQDPAGLEGNHASAAEGARGQLNGHTNVPVTRLVGTRQGDLETRQRGGERSRAVLLL